MHRCFRCVVENQRHTVACRHGNEAVFRLRGAEMFGFANDPVEQFEEPALFGRDELGVADNVNEENVGDLQLDLFVRFSGHKSLSRQGNK